MVNRVNRLYNTISDSKTWEWLYLVGTEGFWGFWTADIIFLFFNQFLDYLSRLRLYIVLCNVLGIIVPIVIIQVLFK